MGRHYFAPEIITEKIAHREEYEAKHGKTEVTLETDGYHVRTAGILGFTIALLCSFKAVEEFYLLHA